MRPGPAPGARTAPGLDGGLLQTLRQLAEQAAPNEAWALLGQSRVGGPLDHVLASDVGGRHCFAVPPSVLMDHPHASGVWHSHPDGLATPSALDQEMAHLWPNLVFLLTTTTGGAVWTWEGPAGPTP